MKLQFGHWIVNSPSGLIATAYRTELPQGPVDMAKHGETIVCIKGGMGRYTCKLKDLVQVLALVEAMPNEYVREVFVTEYQSGPVDFEHFVLAGKAHLAMRISLADLRLKVGR